MKTPESEEQAIVFVIDDDESLREALKNLFGMVGLRAETFAGPAEFTRQWLIRGHARRAKDEQKERAFLLALDRLDHPQGRVAHRFRKELRNRTNSRPAKSCGTVPTVKARPQRGR